MRAERAVRGIDLFARDVSKSVKSTAGEIIGELITTFQASGKVPESLVQHFLSLGPGRDTTGGSGNAYGGLGARDPEKPARCAYNFPGELTFNSQYSFDFILSVFLLSSNCIDSGSKSLG